MNKDSSQFPSSPALQQKNPIKANFALMLETACDDFETMQRLIRREARFVLEDGQ
jgi:hypothetical protein